MGTYYNFNICIGYLVTIPDNMFEVVISPEESHLESRYDPKTGLKVKDKKIIDKYKKSIYMVCGKEVEDDSYGVADTIAEIIKAKAWVLCDNQNRDCVVFGPKLSANEPQMNRIDWGTISTGESFDWSLIASQKPELDRIKIELEKLGFKLKEPIVGIAYSMG
jgi:hypothetical protein